MMGIAFALLLVIAGFAGLFPAVYRFKNHAFSGKQNHADISFSILVACRNEAANLPRLIESIAGGHYPMHLLELIICDDHSTDETATIIKEVQAAAAFRIVFTEINAEIGKKAAIRKAVELATSDHLFLTDADCLLPEDLFPFLQEVIHSKAPKILAGPVSYGGNHSFLHSYQCMESALLLALTSDAFSKKQALMANGANIYVQKDLFMAAESARTDFHIPGGDDVFLVQYAMKQFPHQTLFMASPANRVHTSSEKSWKDLINQRVRWAAKVKYQKHPAGMLWQYAAFVFAFIYAVCILGWPWMGWEIPAVLIVGKTTADWIIFRRLKSLFDYRFPNNHVLIYSIIQPFFILIIGLKTALGNYTWKGRYFDKHPH